MIILPETSAASNLICEPDFHRTIGRERRQRVSQLDWLNRRLDVIAAPGQLGRYASISYERKKKIVRGL